MRFCLSLCSQYRFFGEPVVRACVENGAHHIDISGEPQVSATPPRLPDGVVFFNLSLRVDQGCPKCGAWALCGPWNNFVWPLTVEEERCKFGPFCICLRMRFLWRVYVFKLNFVVFITVFFCDFLPIHYVQLNTAKFFLKKSSFYRPIK